MVIGMKKRKHLLIMACCLGILSAGCGKKEALPQAAEQSAEILEEKEFLAEQTPIEQEQTHIEETPVIQTDSLREQETISKDKLIVIDPGHQRKGNLEKEPIGPNAAEKKYKVSYGTQGKASKLPEYELTLQVALQLKEELLRRGYQVLMTRETHDVNISNSERAMIANEAEADVFIRVHANGSDNPNVNGMLTICPTKNNPYCPQIYEKSALLAAEILDSAAAAAGAAKRSVWETDSMSGINWCAVPVTIIEMGYMTNREEDLKMADSGYQQKIATGIADGIDHYFKKIGVQTEQGETG